MSHLQGKIGKKNPLQSNYFNEKVCKANLNSKETEAYTYDQRNISFESQQTDDQMEINQQTFSDQIDQPDYEGDYKMGKRDGKGTLTWKNGQKFCGSFHEGKINGFGSYTDSNGNEYLGYWKDGKFEPLENDPKYNVESHEGKHPGHGTCIAGQEIDYIGWMNNCAPDLNESLLEKELSKSFYDSNHITDPIVYLTTMDSDSKQTPRTDSKSSEKIQNDSTDTSQNSQEIETDIIIKNIKNNSSKPIATTPHKRNVNEEITDETKLPKDWLQNGKDAEKPICRNVELKAIKKIEELLDEPRENSIIWRLACKKARTFLVKDHNLKNSYSKNPKDAIDILIFFLRDTNQATKYKTVNFEDDVVDKICTTEVKKYEGRVSHKTKKKINQDENLEKLDDEEKQFEESKRNDASKIRELKKTVKKVLEDVRYRLRNMLAEIEMDFMDESCEYGTYVYDISESEGKSKKAISRYLTEQKKINAWSALMQKLGNNGGRKKRSFSSMNGGSYLTI